MCVAALAIDQHPRFRWVLAHNRDEYLDRPAQPMSLWQGSGILAGKDLRGGGTWLGARTGGAWALVTNVRAPGVPREGKRSRGELVTRFLESGRDPADYLAEVESGLVQYGGFTLVCGRLGGGADVLRAGKREHWDPGFHSLSNGTSGGAPWPKCRRLEAGLGRLLAQAEGEFPWERGFELLSDSTQAPDGELPQTGVPLETERALSSVRVQLPGYGTRCSTLGVWDAQAGDWLWAERSYGLNRITDNSYWALTH
ncbi:MAG TPA: NRDE family protein [Bdellovibrionota bacterium]|jgi:uncharacterized protein with NRDE domain|nr:NRDE family protein [Bdellovibrionota bacterium]